MLIGDAFDMAVNARRREMTCISNRNGKNIPRLQRLCKVPLRLRKSNERKTRRKGRLDLCVSRRQGIEVGFEVLFYTRLLAWDKENDISLSTLKLDHSDCDREQGLQLILAVHSNSKIQAVVLSTPAYGS